MATTQPGTPDPAFGTLGEAVLAKIVEEHPELIVQHHIKGLTTDQDGNVLFSASFYRDAPDYTGYIYGLGRLDAKGNLDKKFGNNGLVFDRFVPDLPAGGSRLTVQHDGKILMLGWTLPTSNDPWAALAIARFNSQGNLDTGFAENGVRVLTTHLDDELIEDSPTVHEQPDGYILVTANYFKRGNTELTTGTLFRLQPDGVLDNSFNRDGRLDFKLTDSTAPTAINACISQGSDHKIVIAGHARRPSGLNTALFARFNRDGTLDTLFGNLLTPGFHYVEDEAINNHASLYDLTERSDSSLVGAGQVAGIKTKGLLRAITPSGATHQLFNNGKPLITQFDPMRDNGWQCIMSTHSGHLVTASTGGGIYIAQFKADGALNLAFNHRGYTYIDSQVLTKPVSLTERGDQRVIVAANITGIDPDGLGVLHGYFG
ncbi:hypothetical protein HX871_02795 [Pseudomonas reactans]|uniref:Delta-60 repeat domain-containing protein n=1 Tax=Pseudomonas reactans TaxID=117680 RepID=A0ABX2QSN1_9PSED|nr:hypothetical protein [Pseudomonas reactans]NWA40654.1 hypothetical protein [Pseudomonas reactans]NWD93331.1 hypothetical protein [Pseudomonas reactans]